MKKDYRNNIRGLSDENLMDFITNHRVFEGDTRSFNILMYACNLAQKRGIRSATGERLI